MGAVRASFSHFPHKEQGAVCASYLPVSPKEQGAVCASLSPFLTEEQGAVCASLSPFLPKNGGVCAEFSLIPGYPRGVCAEFFLITRVSERCLRRGVPTWVYIGWCTCWGTYLGVHRGVYMQGISSWVYIGWCICRVYLPICPPLPIMENIHHPMPPCHPVLPGTPLYTRWSTSMYTGTPHWSVSQRGGPGLSSEISYVYEAHRALPAPKGVMVGRQLCAEC